MMVTYVFIYQTVACLKYISLTHLPTLFTPVSGLQIIYEGPYILQDFLNAKHYSWNNSFTHGLWFLFHSFFERSTDISSL